MASFQLLSLFQIWWLCLAFLVAVVIKCGAEDVVGQTSGEAAAADKYLSTFGYYPRQARDLADDSVSTMPRAEEKVPGHTDTERHRAIERLQEFFHLPVNGQLDKNTKTIMTTARCGRKDIDVSSREDENRDTDGLQTGSRRVKRYSLSKYADGTYGNWKNISQLTWRIVRPSRQISESQQKEIIRTSLAMWAQYMPITFVEDRPQNTPDISIDFVKREHGPHPDPIFDGSPSGTLNVLAHAWGPGYNPKGLAGDVHFDDDDNWKNYSTLLGVAVHELGHAMGLGHSDDDESIMYPVYRDAVTKLGRDDINGIKEMYKNTQVIPEANKPRTRAPILWSHRPDIRYPTKPSVPRYQTERPDPRYRTRQPDPRYRTRQPDPRYRTDRPDPGYRTDRPDSRYQTRQPDPRIVPLDPRTRAPYNPEWERQTEPAVDLCTTFNVDAVFEDPNTKLGRSYIAVSDGYVHTLTQHGVLIKSQQLKDVFKDVPINPDVAFSIYNKQTVYFIKDNNMWAYKENQLEEGYPRSLHSFRFPEHPKFSLTLDQQDGTSRLLLFGDHYWWTFDMDRSATISYYPISDFSGDLPSGVRFAARWIDNYVYAVTQDSYVVMDMDTRRMVYKEPIAGKPEWLHALCGDATRVSLSVTSLAVLVILANIFKFVIL